MESHESCWAADGRAWKGDGRAQALVGPGLATPLSMINKYDSSYLANSRNWHENYQLNFNTSKDTLKYGDVTTRQVGQVFT